MTAKIVRVRHRHSDQKRYEADLTLEIGCPLHSFYQAGRPPGTVVSAFGGDDPILCYLDCREIIFIGKTNVKAIDYKE